MKRGLGVLLTTDWQIRVLPEAFIKTPIPHGGNRADDLVDVAVLRLPPEFAVGITAGHFGFYYLATIPNGAFEPGERLKFMGFPAQAQRDRSYAFHLHDGSQIILNPRGLSSPLLPHDAYPAKNLLSPNFCYVSPYMNPSTRKESESLEAPFMPPGMSGGPIFAYRDNALHLVGGISNWGNKEGYFIGTRLDYVANLLEQAVA